MTPSVPLTDPDLDRRGRLLVLAICCASILVVVMDISIVNVALPDIRSDLDASTSELQWTIDAYTLVLATFLVLAGSLADRFGRRRVFVIGLTIFGLGSLACGLAPGIGWLIGARAFQAVGGTMLNPVAMAIVANTFTDPAERARAIGIFGSISGLALALGPVLGGVLVDTLGWRSVFVVNVPIVAVAVACAVRFVPESRALHARRFDPVGQALVAILLGSVVYAVVEARSLGWGSAPILGLMAAAVASVAVLVPYESRRREPLIELRLLRSVPLASAIVMAVVAMCGFQAFLFVSTLYLQDVRGLSPLDAGLTLLPVGALVLVLAPVSGGLVASGGPRRPLLIAGGALTLAGVALLGLSPTTGLALVVATYVLVGAFLGLVNPPITNSAVSGMPRSMSGVAAALASSGRQTGTTLGVAIAGAVVASGLEQGGDSFTGAAQGVWWMVVGLGLALVLLTLVSTSPWAERSAGRAAALFADDAAGVAGALTPAGSPCGAAR